MEGWVCKVVEVFLQVLQVPHQQGDLSPWKACSSYSIRWRHARTIPSLSISFLYFTLLLVSLKFLLSVYQMIKLLPLGFLWGKVGVFILYIANFVRMCYPWVYICMSSFVYFLKLHLYIKLLFCMPFEFMCYLMTAKDSCFSALTLVFWTQEFFIFCLDDHITIFGAFNISFL